MRKKVSKMGRPKLTDREVGELVRRCEDKVIELARDGEKAGVNDLMQALKLSRRVFYNYRERYARLISGVPPNLHTCQNPDPKQCTCLRDRLQQLWLKVLPSRHDDDGVIRILCYPQNGNGLGIRLDPVDRPVREWSEESKADKAWSTANTRAAKS